MEHLGTKTIETKRLLLRRLTVEDTDSAFKNWTSDKEVTKYLEWPTHENISLTKGIIEMWVKNYSKNNFYQWGIILKDMNELIGTISVVNNNDKVKMVEMGYCIGKQWWNKGITSEALTALIKFFFEEVGINRIQAWHDTKNISSRKVMEKCGMIYEGCLRQSHENNSGICDRNIFSIIAEDYF